MGEKMRERVGRISEAGHRREDLTIEVYNGGVEAGGCVQLTQMGEDGAYHYVQLRKADLHSLIKLLVLQDII